MVSDIGDFEKRSSYASSPYPANLIARRGKKVNLSERLRYEPISLDSPTRPARKKEEAVIVGAPRIVLPSFGRSEGFTGAFMPPTAFSRTVTYSGPYSHLLREYWREQTVASQPMAWRYEFGSTCSVTYVELENCDGGQGVILVDANVPGREDEKSVIEAPMKLRVGANVWHREAAAWATDTTLFHTHSTWRMLLRRRFGAAVARVVPRPTSGLLRASLPIFGRPLGAISKAECLIWRGLTLQSQSSNPPSDNPQLLILILMDSELSITKIDDNIATFRKSLSQLHRYHSEYINYVHILAIAQFARYKLSHEKEDVDKSILHFTEAIFLPPVSRASPSLNFVEVLLHLALALLERSENFERPEDVKYAIEYLWYIRRFPPDSFDVPRTFVTTSPIRALRTQVKWGGGNWTRDIKEMVDLFCELLTSNSSANFPAAAFQSFNEAANVEYDRGFPIELLDEVIEWLRDAMKVCPPASSSESYGTLFPLVSLLGARFRRTHSLDDYEEATALLKKILSPNQPGGFPHSIRHEALVLATELTVTRWNVFDNPEYSEVAISHLRALLASEYSEELRYQHAETLALLSTRRFRDYGLSESLEEANSNISQAVGTSSSQNLGKPGRLLGETELVLVRNTYSTAALQRKIQDLEELLSKTPPGTRRTVCLSELADCYETKFNQTDDILDIEESIKYSKMWLDATHTSDPWRVTPLASLRTMLLHAFKKTGKISYLDESITLGYDILELKTAQEFHVSVTRCLVQSLLTREKLLGGIEDRREAIRLISVVINYQYAREPDRFGLACEWAILARSISHPTTLTAYKTAMLLMQKSLSFAPTVSVQHTRLIAMGENCQTMPLEYASYQINLGRFEEAVEKLELGRALLWSEMRGLRTSVAQFLEDDSSLTKRFAEINQELEEMTISVTPTGRPDIEDGYTQDRDWMDPFGRLVVKRKKLAEERDALISEIQSRPGMEGFLKAPAFTTLCSAALRGPIIIINHCAWRSDIVIIFHKSLPCAIPTDDDFYDRANKLQGELVEARKCGLDSKEYQDALCSVLKGLYELVGEPVIMRLRLLGVPEQSRIWWCPTSVFCSLPLHAMGPIPSSKTPKQYFSDLYIPSYTPSLSALIESRKGSPRRALKAGVTVKGLVSSEATPSSVLEALRGSRLAHFACHGVLETGKPFDASFKLHGGSHLTLLDTVRSRLPDAEFAFLSCCHAAEITEKSVGDEGLHLTAAMQYCGFRSVVGTMWEMADTDGKDLAKNFYESLFSSQDSGVPYYERSAGALRDATKKLREKRGINLERWVNFVHYGA
ncbi:CHAT domain-containing protein [Lactarius quietus]|nr:CHAT domain-containing protein [Lactarius quietus]